jgi:uncharacterized membrane protein YjgN (DUF898 family)
VAATAAPPATFEPQGLVFTGVGREYFRIWVANLILTIVTLGFYSPWAKVRRLEYFYRNTRLAGACFDFHGSPMALLRGRIVAIVLFGAYYIAGRMDPVYGLVALGVLMLVLPALICRTLRFRLHNSSYRGLRFSFNGTIAEAYWVYLGLPVLSFFTFLWLAPFAHQRMKRYQHRHAAYGRTAFSIDAPVGEFYLTYLGAAGSFVVAMFLIVMAVMAVMAVTIGIGGGGADEPEMPDWFVLVFLAFYLPMILFMRAFVTARIQNTVWRATRLGAHRFWSRISIFRLFLIQLTNVAAIIFTLGLFTPFAQVRTARYLAGAVTLLPAASLDDEVAGESQRVSAIGEEATDVFDIDLAF